MAILLYCNQTYGGSVPAELPLDSMVYQLYNYFEVPNDGLLSFAGHALSRRDSTMLADAGICPQATLTIIDKVEPQRAIIYSYEGVILHNLAVLHVDITYTEEIVIAMARELGFIPCGQTRVIIEEDDDALYDEEKIRTMTDAFPIHNLAQLYIRKLCRFYAWHDKEDFETITNGQRIQETKNQSYMYQQMIDINMNMKGYDSCNESTGLTDSDSDSDEE